MYGIPILKIRRWCSTLLRRHLYIETGSRIPLHNVSRARTGPCNYTPRILVPAGDTCFLHINRIIVLKCGVHHVELITPRIIEVILYKYFILVNGTTVNIANQLKFVTKTTQQFNKSKYGHDDIYTTVNIIIFAVRSFYITLTIKWYQ